MNSRHRTGAVAQRGRANVQILTETHEKLKQLAGTKGTSLANLLRILVDREHTAQNYQKVRGTCNETGSTGT